MAGREQGFLAGHERAACRRREVGQAGGACLLDGCLHLEEQCLAVFGPTLLVLLFNGVVTNDKFCWTRFGRLSLSFWRRPLRLRAVAASGEHATPSETAMQGLGGGSDAPLLAGPATGPAA